MTETVTAARLSDADLDRLIEELDAASDKLPEEALRTAQRHREQVAPRLIQAIQNATAAARAGSEDLGNAHFFAVFLLIEFEAREALPAILEAVSLPHDLPFDLFGDAVHEALPQALALFAADQTEIIEALIENSAVNGYVAWAAVESYRYLIRDGRITRDEVVARLRRHLRNAIDRESAELAGSLVSELSGLAAGEACEEIKEAFRRNLIDEFMIRLRDIEQDIAEGESRIRETLERCPPTRLQDTVAELRTWGAFDEQPEPRPFRSAAAAYDPLDDMDLDADDEPAPYLAARAPIVSDAPRIGRNDPCPCGSGRKYKKCCGAPS